MARIKRSGRPKVIESARKHNVYLSGDLDAHVQSIADAKFLSFSAALRVALREHMAMKGTPACA